MRYEELLEKNPDIPVDMVHFSSSRLKGLYCNGRIALSSQLRTDSEKICVLAEELGHHYTSFGDILNQESVNNRKQELYARSWAYKQLITLERLASAYDAGCTNRYEIAEYLNITEQFLDEALAFLHAKYGLSVKYNDYIFDFSCGLNCFKVNQ